MNNIDQLLQAYKTLSDNVAKSQAINEKIFKEMIVSKVRKSFGQLKLYDISCTAIGIIAIPYLVYWSYLCRSQTDVFIMSLMLFVLFITMMLHQFKQYKWKFSMELFVENDMRETLSRIKETTIMVKKLRHYGMYFIIPIMILELPVGWYAMKKFYYIDVIKYHWEHSLWYLISIPFIFVLAIYLAWKLFDWMYFNTFKKIKSNIEQLEE